MVAVRGQLDGDGRVRWSWGWPDPMSSCSFCLSSFGPLESMHQKTKTKTKLVREAMEDTPILGCVEVLERPTVQFTVLEDTGRH